MGVDFILLADGATINKVLNEKSKSRPPEVVFEDGLHVEDAHVARGRRGVKRVE